MADDIKDFLDDVKTTVSGLSDIDATYIVPAVDIEQALRVPRFPMALINDGGGSLSEFNGKLWTRTLEVTILMHVPRDHVGEEAVRQLFDIGEALVAALEYDDGESVYLVGDSDVTAQPFANTGTVIVSKTYAFEYQIRRS